ncbi:hypothetical protein M0G74_06395 [Microbulbifer sp. CAU 1566]|uniref:hypothetical protein n=1 Tax=Microbulbifer sp. CAU 1566 TaxID=2933269 RepID=UPI002004C28E|nr:hypothetical protein [Microbulbifer sp. CAU 1566]MCK7596899.1 hypothetical protein [Microbulbifer sp. CAU 1566]
MQQPTHTLRNKKQLNPEAVILAPEICSLIESPELCIEFFRKAEAGYKSSTAVIYDLEKTTTVTETFVAVLIAFIKDRNISLLKPSKFRWPKDKACDQKLKKLGILRSFSQQGDVVDLEHLQPQRLTNKKVQNYWAKSAVDLATKFLYGESRRIKELYSILIEIMANTNNHADREIAGKYPWWLIYFADDERDVVKFVILDLGVGIFESLPVKQHIIRSPLPVRVAGGNANHHLSLLRGMQLEKVLKDLVDGKIKSSTQDPARGRGMPLIADCAQSGNFENFVIIANDGYVDLINSTVSVMNENFSGTIYYFELKKN